MTGRSAIRDFPDRLQQTEAVKLGHHCVGDDEIGRISPDRLDRRISVFRSLDVPMGAEQSSDIGAHVRIVVGDQDVAMHLVPHRHPGWRRPASRQRFRRGSLGNQLNASSTYASAR